MQVFLCNRFQSISLQGWGPHNGHMCQAREYRGSRGAWVIGSAAAPCNVTPDSSTKTLTSKYYVCTHTHTLCLVISNHLSSRHTLDDLDSTDRVSTPSPDCVAQASLPRRLAPSSNVASSSSQPMHRLIHYINIQINRFTFNDNRYFLVAYN